MHRSVADGAQPTLRIRCRSAHTRPIVLHRARAQGGAGDVHLLLYASGRARLWESFGRGAALPNATSEELPFPMEGGSGLWLQGKDGTKALVPFAPPSGLELVEGVPMAAP